MKILTVKYDIYKVKLLLVRLVVETSRLVAPYVQVFCAYRSPRWIGSCKHMVYAENVQFFGRAPNLEGIRSLESLCSTLVPKRVGDTSLISI